MWPSRLTITKFEVIPKEQVNVIKRSVHRLLVSGIVNNLIYTRDAPLTTWLLRKSPFCLWYPDSKVHGANIRPIWGRQDPGGSHVGPMNVAI